MEIKKYKYDVAFSFCQEDEYLANEIRGFLSDNLSVFIYSKMQNELVGSDGEIEFKKAFFELSRVVVVLYRENYGKTSWTRMEEEAIRNRAYDEGYDFTLFIPLDENKKTPIYLPKTRIWYNLERFGSKGAANIISFIINERGGNSKYISSEEKAARLKNKLEFENKIKNYLSSNQAFEDSNEEMNLMIEIGQNKANKAFKGLNIKFETSPKSLFKIFYEKYLLQFSWKTTFGIINDDACLEISKWKYYDSNDPLEQSKFYNESADKYLFYKNLNWENVWKSEIKDEYMKTDMIVEYYISDFIDYIDKQKFDKKDDFNVSWI